MGGGATASSAPSYQKYRIGDLLGVYWRPHFDSTLIPSLPLHIERPKERIEIFQILLPVKAVMKTKEKLDYVKLSMLEHESDNPMLNTLPGMLSRFTLRKMDVPRS